MPRTTKFQWTILDLIKLPDIKVMTSHPYFLDSPSLRSLTRVLTLDRRELLGSRTQEENVAEVVHSLVLRFAEARTLALCSRYRRMENTVVSDDSVSPEHSSSCTFGIP